MREIREIINDLSESRGTLVHLSDEICDIFRIGKRNGRLRFHAVPRALSGDMNAAVKLLNTVLPGWGWRMATCCVSDDAWIFPDYNCPSHGERLKKEFDERIPWIDLTDVDLRPPGRPAVALLISILLALEHMNDAGSD